MFLAALLILGIVITPGLSQEKPGTASHVSIHHQEKDGNYRVSYTFKDQWETMRKIELSFPTEKTTQMIRQFGIPQSLFETYYATPDAVSRREQTIKSGLFRQNGKTIEVDKDAVLNYYAQDFGRPIANWIIRTLKDEARDTRRNRIELAMRIVQDIPYGVPNNESRERYYGGILTPPQVLLSGYGDCDSKAILFVSVLAFLISPNDIVFVGQPNHVLTAIKDDPGPGEVYFQSNGSKYVIAETAGPGRYDYGDKGNNYSGNSAIERIHFGTAGKDVIASGAAMPRVEPQASGNRNASVKAASPDNVKPRVRISFKNECSVEARVILETMTLNGEWVAKGWQVLKPGETAYLGDTRNRYFYYYAETEKGRWSGDHPITFEGKSFNLSKATLSEGDVESFTMSLKCR